MDIFVKYFIIFTLFRGTLATNAQGDCDEMEAYNCLSSIASHFYHDRPVCELLTIETLTSWVDQTWKCMSNYTKDCPDNIRLYLVQQLDLQEKGLRVELEHCYYRGICRNFQRCADDFHVYAMESPQGICGMPGLDAAEECIMNDFSQCDLHELYKSAFRYYRMSCNNSDPIECSDRHEKLGECYMKMVNATLNYRLAKFSDQEPQCGMFEEAMDCIKATVEGCYILAAWYIFHIAPDIPYTRDCGYDYHFLNYVAGPTTTQRTTTQATTQKLQTPQETTTTTTTTPTKEKPNGKSNAKDNSQGKRPQYLHLTVNTTAKHSSSSSVRSVWQSAVAVAAVVIWTFGV